MIWLGEILLSIGITVSLCFRLFSFNVAAAIIVVTIFAVLWKLKRYHNHWNSVGISGPPPNLFLGNLLELKKGLANVQVEWYEKYGDVVGTYVFGKTELQVSDTNILKDVMLKKFGEFTDRVNFIPVNPKDRSNLFSNTLLFMEGDRWKNVRSQVTPAFTSGKIKKMIPMFAKCARLCGDIMLQLQKEGKEVDLKRVCGPLTLEMIAKGGFGAELELQTRKDQEFYKNAKAYFKPNMTDVLAMVLFLFPVLGPLFQRFTGIVLLRHKENAYFTELLSSILQRRKMEKESLVEEKQTDFFGILLNSLQVEEKVDDEFYHDEYSKLQKASLTELDIISQGFVFLLAGYDTSSTTMSLLLYHLAAFPEIQEKLRKEINTHVDDPDELTYDQIVKCSYLDQVFKEVLRMYPMFVRVNRVCTKDTTIGDSIPMRKGDVVAIPIRLIHFKEEFYPEPHKFDPERFSPENRANADPLSYIPFGFGPRNCVGMRIAQFLVKTAVVHLVKRFNFKLTENSAPLPLDFLSFGPIKLKDGLLVRVEEIEKNC